MGQSKSDKCSHCQAVLPSSTTGGAVLKFCPFCGKPLPQPAPEPKQPKSHFQPMQQIDGGYVLLLGDDPIAATPAQPVQPPVEPAKLVEPPKPVEPLRPIQPHRPEQPVLPESKTQTPRPRGKESSHESHGHHSHHHDHHHHSSSSHRHAHKDVTDKPVAKSPVVQPVPPHSPSSTPDKASTDDTIDLLSLDLDMVDAQLQSTDSQSQSNPAIPAKPSRLKHISEPVIQPKPTPVKPVPHPPKAVAKSSNDDTVLPMIDQPVVGTSAKPNKPAKLNAMDDTLAGLQDEEDQLDLAEAEEVVVLKVDHDDDDLMASTGGLVVTDVVDEDELDTQIKPEETVPVVGLNMLQEHVGRASSWDRVPLPELAAADQSSVYELAVEPEVAAGKVCPECNVQMPFDAVVCAACGYSIQLGRRVAGVSGDPMGDRYDGSERYVSESEKYEADQEYYHRQHMINDIYVPSVVLLAMLVFLVFTVVAVCPYEMVDRNIVEKVIPSKMPAPTTAAPLPGANAPGMGGIAVNFMSQFAAAPPPPPLTRQQKWFCIAYLFGTNLMQIAIKIPFMFLGMLLVIRLFGVSFGGVFSAITKMLAIAMTAHVLAYFVEAVMFILTEGISLFGMESYVSFPFAIISFIGLNMKFFELDVQEAFVLYLASYLMPMFASMMVAMWIFAMLT